MKHLIHYFSIALCLMVALSGCDDLLYDDHDTHKDEYTVDYNVTYSTIYDFHNIAHASFTLFFDEDGDYTGRPRQVERVLDDTHRYFRVERVPQGAHVEFSTFVDVPEALPNTKAKISIEISKGHSYEYTEVASIEADCPLRDNPLTLTYDIPNK
ncbi:MAG: hypothetical protein KBT10_03560 [Bacteroidales bacterium]|nr:hypothetical protein [Candidatus Sodaliphilus aphodohippi]